MTYNEILLSGEINNIIINTLHWDLLVRSIHLMRIVI